MRIRFGVFLMQWPEVIGKSDLCQLEAFAAKHSNYLLEAVARRDGSLDQFIETHLAIFAVRYGARLWYWALGVR